MAEGDLLKIATVVNLGVLNNRVAAAIEQTAVFVLASGASTQNNKAFALRALQDPLTEANSKWLWLVAADSRVFSQVADPTQVTDAIIDTIVAANWPLLWA